MLRTAKQIADNFGIDMQIIADFMTAHKIRASSEKEQVKYYDESAQAYMISSLINHTERTIPKQKPQSRQNSGRKLQSVIFP